MTKLCAICGAILFLIGATLGFVARSKMDKVSRFVTVHPIHRYEPEEIVPDSVDWPRGDPVAVATVVPPTQKERRKLESDFGLNLDKTAILNRFTLPPMPDGGKAVVTVPVSDKPEPVSLVVKVNPPPLLKIRWEPEVSSWYGYGNSTESGTVSPSWAMYFSLGDLVCMRDKVCLTGRAGREERPWGAGWVAEAGVSIRLR